ncbi:wnt inhibitory factor 1 isoform X1 [Electrophorus electricus]|uniref:wnt inhibitory factor 1 isoform X1 n=3 Tax=Electrophorus electricus TaxID=8005 RepID=UPI0015D08337|nr:wnt inhibitory factor 1 isoform X1 [Electrophorus electricus]
MAFGTPMFQLYFKTYFFLLLGGLVVEAAPEQGSLCMWIDANQARILIGFEEDILIVSEGRMAPFTHDFKKAQQRMPAIPVHIHYVNFTWQVTDQAEYFYEFQTLRSFDKDIMDDPTVNVPRLGSVPHKASVVQVGFPCRGDQDGVAAFEVTILVMDGGGNIVLRTPHNAIFFKSCQRAKCPGGCRNGGYCNERQVCECHDGFYGTQCEKALCSPRCMNGGLCMSPGLCGCPPGYYGASCEKANCSTTCFNGGTCFHPGKCVCPTGFEGSRCEKSKCRQPCRNGGKCMGKNKCKCSKGYHGDLCSKAVCEPSCGAHGTCLEPNRCQCRDGWHGRHCNKRYRGGSSTIPRPSGPRPKPHTTSERELRVASDTNRPSDTNYVV